MKEFLFKDKIGNIEDSLKLTRKGICTIILNAELMLEPPISYFRHPAIYSYFLRNIYRKYNKNEKGYKKN